MTRFTQRLSTETEAMWSDICSAIMDSANEHLNVVQTRKNRWISERTVQLIAKKREAHIAWMRCQENEMTRKHYVSLCKQVKRAVRQDKEEWLHEQASDLEYDLKHHNHYEFFRKLKNFDHVPIQPTSVILYEHGLKLLCTDDQLDRWKRHFASVLNVRRPIAIDSGMVLRSVGSGAPLSEEEITNAIKKLKNNRAYGNDGITAELLKDGPTELFDWLSELLQQVWSSGRVPQDWKD